MFSFFDFLQNYQLGNNTGFDYLQAGLAFGGLLLVLKLFQLLIISRLKKLAEKTKTDFDDVLIEILSRVKPPFYLLIALFLALQLINLTVWIDQVVKLFFLLAIISEFIQAIDRLLIYALNKYLTKKNGVEEAKQSETMVAIISTIVKIILWVIGILLILSNFGVNVTSLIASLGIGGIAIALALQNILGDLFSSFTIFLDKPFQVGDFIIIDKNMGTVEKVGLKTTRIRSIGGEQLVVSNQELTSIRVQNFGRMQRRRVVFKIGVTYQTPSEKIISASQAIKKLIDETQEVTFDRCHFYEFGDSSLNFEVVMYVESADYNQYMNLRQIIHLGLLKKFQELGIDFAYPTQTVFLEK